MAAIGSWNKVKPAGTDSLKTSDDLIRANWAALETAFPQMADSSKGTGAIGWCFDGDCYTGTKFGSVVLPWPITIILVKVYADTAPTGATLIVDVNKNGTTIFTTQANRPTIADGGNADDSGTPDVTAAAAGDRLSYDIDQIGSGDAGGNHLTVTLYYNRA